jgi:hypothetical protein
VVLGLARGRAVSFRLHPTGGVCNRLRAIFSHLAAHGSIDVEWDGDLPRHFLDLFEPIEGLNFTTGHTGHHDCGICAAAPAAWHSQYRKLQPVASIYRRILDARAALGGEYIAMHVRRTDMTPLAASIGLSLPTDEEYMAWMAAHPVLPVFLATDNGETQRKYQAHDPRVRILAPMQGVETVRDMNDHSSMFNGPQEDAVVDLFVCAHASSFMGSGAFGTFSNTIEILRGLR